MCKQLHTCVCMCVCINALTSYYHSKMKFLELCSKFFKNSPLSNWPLLSLLCTFHFTFKCEITPMCSLDVITPL